MAFWRQSLWQVCNEEKGKACLSTRMMDICCSTALHKQNRKRGKLSKYARICILFWTPVNASPVSAKDKPNSCLILVNVIFVCRSGAENRRWSERRLPFVSNTNTKVPGSKLTNMECSVANRVLVWVLHEPCWEQFTLSQTEHGSVPGIDEPKKIKVGTNYYWKLSPQASRRWRRRPRARCRTTWPCSWSCTGPPSWWCRWAGRRCCWPCWGQGRRRTRRAWGRNCAKCASWS